jgi:hypothetical protein
MFIPHHPLPIRTVRYFLPPALRILGAARAIPEATEALRKLRRFIGMFIPPSS